MEEADESDEDDTCQVELEGGNNGCSSAIAELGGIFDSRDLIAGQGQYCDWACENGEAIVKALAAIA